MATIPHQPRARQPRTAKILTPRWRCWTCQGRRVIAVTDKTIIRCPACNGTDPHTHAAREAA